MPPLGSCRGQSSSEEEQGEERSEGQGGVSWEWGQLQGRGKEGRIDPSPTGTCSVSQPICLMSGLPAVLVAASSACSSSLTQGTRVLIWAWMAAAHNLALASSLALRKRVSWPSAEQISRYLQAQIGKEEDLSTGLQLPSPETGPRNPIYHKTRRNH